MLTVESETTGGATAQEDAPIPAEILALIAAAATAFLDQQLHIRAIKQLPSSGEQVSRWSRQGRALVQSSHNLAVKHPQKTE